MLPTLRRPHVKGIPSLFRSAGIAAFFVGLLIAYVDTQKMAARQMALNGRVAESQPIEDFIAIGTMPAGDEVALAAHVDPDAGFLVTYRRGLARRSAQVLPLWSAKAGERSTVLGFAYADADAPPLATLIDVQTSGMASVLGLAQAPGTLASAARDRMLAAGLPVSQDLFSVMPYAQEREAVLSAPVRSPWRAVMFWMSAVLLTGGYILNIESFRIKAERRRIALARASTARAGTVGSFAPGNAADRFSPIGDREEADVAEGPEAAARKGWISRARQWISRPA